MARMRALDVSWDQDERHVLEAHEAWADEVVGFLGSWLTAMTQPGVDAWDLPRPAERPDDPRGETRYRTHLDWERTLDADFTAAVRSFVELASWEADLRDGAPERTVRALTRAVHDTGAAFRRVGGRLSEGARRRSQRLRYWDDPWNAELLEGLDLYG